MITAAGIVSAACLLPTTEVLGRALVVGYLGDRGMAKPDDPRRL